MLGVQCWASSVGRPVLGVECGEVPADVIETDLPRFVSLDDHVIVMCDEGYQSSLVAATLQEIGFHRATDLAGGFQAWVLAGLPVETATHTRFELRGSTQIEWIPGRSAPPPIHCLRLG